MTILSPKLRLTNMFKKYTHRPLILLQISHMTTIGWWYGLSWVDTSYWNKLGISRPLFVWRPIWYLLILAFVLLTVRELGAAAYQLGNTSSRTITEVKQRWAWLVLGWEKNCSSVAWVLLLTLCAVPIHGHIAASRTEHLWVRHICHETSLMRTHIYS